ncbi:A-kinase anchor protein 17B-like isoform X1 [Falco biarmicus]|uniref:A-kinase anchor protein 17B isoform X1 n=1 Tax=Falco peregrinus TaxID=8954 RepID=UPI000FFBBA52|nr:A-kinase anchor protein 17B isoform X1 [Falco peregrinus]XP_055673946.1 A-kinase anchor protein 17B isoform X1 [Falco peregrinus]XP_055673947.1 A-kinase anchor protein 17B isoform X1 [Falco peregrinus]XP_055673948.1 A-kinase anchor protein 17B isoform X1 [Falco peregrinus]XP_055673949.1 A-kinase anchor protein 17B isoform X1 [Falco peregrinus]XP_056215624.1 A-kinase anchor protein 17B-like isoform X1 [Falco biarmicus]XP_056215625.1 A-kinase anchor protein 17B-like isoform X1 [Falco biarmic
MPEWEERKSLLAQRRVESVRLLTVLLNHVKDFVQLASQKVDPSLGVRKDNSFPETGLKGTHQELINPHYLTHKELKRKKEFKCPLTRKSSSLCSEEGDASNYHASTCHIVRTILSDSSTAPSSDGLPGRDAHNSFGCGSLLITVTQDCRVIESLDGRDFPALNVVHTQTVSDEDGCKKPKVYETDEFIHYLLNYYQTPRYARVCLEPKSTVNKSWWKRVVSDDDSGFDICLSNKHGERFRGASPVQNLNRRNCSSDGNYRLVITIGELGSTDTVLENKAYGGRLARSLEVQRNDSLTADNLPRAGLNHSLDCTAVTHDKEFKQEGSDEGTVPYETCRSACRLKDLLEEMSDSEYFRGARSSSMKRTERRCEEIYSNCGKGCLPARAGERKLLVYLKNVTLEGQEKENSKCSFCCNAVHEDLARECEHKFKKSCKRSSSKLRHEGQKSERQSGEEERSAHKMKKKPKKFSSNLLSDECGFSEMDSCMQLESLRKIQRKYKKMFHKKVKFKTLHRTMAAPGVTPRDGSQLQGTIQSTGDDKKLMFRRDVDADVRGCSLFPLEIIQTNPCSDTFCGAEPRRGC